MYQRKSKKSTPRVCKSVNNINRIGERNINTHKRNNTARIYKNVKRKAEIDLLKRGQAIVAILLVISILPIINWGSASKENKELIATFEEEVEVVYVDVNDKVVETIENTFDNYNENVKGWIRIEGTEINYPIVQGTNNDYYLNHNVNDERNKAGWIFADYRNNLSELDKNTIIYGHNMKDGTMFAELEKLTEKSWNNTNNLFSFNTRDQNYVAEIISVYKIKATDFIVRNTFSNNEFKEYINEIKEKSIYDFNTEVLDDEKIITLYTCDDNNVNRIIVQAKLIKV